MLPRVRIIAAVYRAATVVIAAIAVARVIGVGTPHFAPGGLLYYTSLSNLLGLAWMLVALVVTLIRIQRHGVAGTASVAPRVGAGVGLALLVTMLIYLIILVPTSFVQGANYQPFTLTDNLVHIVVPVLVLGDWVLFAQKGRLRWIDPLLWASIPYAYVAFALLRPVFTAAPWPSGGRYPYPFFDVDTLGWGGVILYLAGLTVAIEAIAFGIVAIDHWWARRAGRSAAIAHGDESP